MKLNIRYIKTGLYILVFLVPILNGLRNDNLLAALFFSAPINLVLWVLIIESISWAIKKIKKKG